MNNSISCGYLTKYPEISITESQKQTWLETITIQTYHHEQPCLIMDIDKSLPALNQTQNNHDKMSETYSKQIKKKMAICIWTQDVRNTLKIDFKKMPICIWTQKTKQSQQIAF